MPETVTATVRRVPVRSRPAIAGSMDAVLLTSIVAEEIENLRRIEEGLRADVKQPNFLTKERAAGLVNLSHRTLAQALSNTVQAC